MHLDAVVKFHGVKCDGERRRKQEKKTDSLSSYVATS